MNKLSLSDAAKNVLQEATSAEIFQGSKDSAGGDKTFGSAGYKPKVKAPQQEIKKIGTAGHKTTDPSYDATDGVPTATPPGATPPVKAEPMKKLSSQPQQTMGRKDLAGTPEGSETSDEDKTNRKKGPMPKQTMKANPGASSTCCEETIMEMTLQNVEHDLEQLSDEAFMKKYRMPKKEAAKEIAAMEKKGKVSESLIVEVSLQDVEKDLEQLSDEAFMKKYKMPKKEAAKEIAAMEKQKGKMSEDYVSEASLQSVERDLEQLSDEQFMKKYRMPKKEAAKEIAAMEKQKGKMSEDYEEASIEEVEYDIQTLTKEDFILKYEMSINEAKKIVAKEKEKLNSDFCNTNMREDIEAMLSGENLSEDFKEKATLIFEAAVEARVEEISASLEEKFQYELEIASDELKEDYADKLDSYLDYVVETWMDENKLAIERGLKSEIVEDFINSLRNVFVEHYIDIPEDRVNVVEELVAKVEDLEEQVNDQIKKNVELKRSITEQKKIENINSVCEGLTLSQSEKIKSIAKSVEYVSEDDFMDKLETIKESYFSRPVKSQSAQSLNEVVEYDEDQSNYSDPLISKYVKQISKFSKF